MNTNGPVRERLAGRGKRQRHKLKSACNLRNNTHSPGLSNFSGRWDCSRIAEYADPSYGGKCGNLGPGKSWLSRSEILQVRLRDLEMGTYLPGPSPRKEDQNGRDIG